MAIYWFLFAYFAIGAIVASSMPDDPARRPNVLYTAGAVVMGLLIGLRFKVGGDWVTYLFMFRRAGQMDFPQALRLGDPGYQAINWIAYQAGGEVWLVNLIAAAIFVWGLLRLCQTQPAPWLAVVVAVPYMVIVMAMGFTRQAVALGILMAGIAAFTRGATLLRFAAYVFVAALFHKTAVVGFPLVALTTQRNRMTNLLLVVSGCLLLYDAFLGDAMDHFVQNYIRAHYSSQGAAIRIAMNMVAAVIFWIAGRRLKFGSFERKIWRNFSIASLLSLGMLIIIPSSAAIDRISLYLIPFQLAVLSRVPMIFHFRLVGTIVVVAYSFTVEFVWLNFAQFAGAWVPYKLFPI